MAQGESPLNRSIGLSGVIRWLIAVFAMIAIGAAFADRQYLLGVIGVVFIVGAAIVGYRAWRARQPVDDATPPNVGS